MVGANSRPTGKPKQRAQAKRAPGRNLRQTNGAGTVAQRTAAQAAMIQSLQAQVRALTLGARTKSIQPGLAPTKQERFTKGALKNITFAPRGFGYYDAFTQTPDSACTSMSVGPVTTMVGHAIVPANGSSNSYVSYTGPQGEKNIATNKQLIIFNPGSSNDVVGQIYRYATDHTIGLSGTVYNATLSVTDITASQYDVLTDVGDSAEAPRGIENIPLRGSIKIQNVTETRAVGGVVRVLRYNGGLEMNRIVYKYDADLDTLLLWDHTLSEAFYWNTAGEHNTSFSWVKSSSSTQERVASLPVATDHQMEGVIPYSQSPVYYSSRGDPVSHKDSFEALCQMIRTSDRTKRFGAHELLSPHQSNCYPADMVRSLTFDYGKSFEAALAQPSYCTVLILIEDFTSSSSGLGNSYELTCRVHRAGRFAPGTLHHSRAVTLTQNNHPQGEQHRPAAALAQYDFEPAH